jgi:hypothetical protein
VRDAVLLDLYGPVLGGVSIKEMSWRDSDDPDKAMLAVLSDPHDLFLPALALFPNRVAVANVRGDPLVSYTTAAIATSNPYSNFRSNDSKVAHRLMQEPCHVVSVLPHPDASSSDHIINYDAFGLEPGTDQEPLLASGFSAFGYVISIFSTLLVGIFGFVLGTFIILPGCAIRNRFRARADARELAKRGVFRRNAVSLKRRFDWRAPLRQVQPSDSAMRNIEACAPFSRVAVMLDGFNTHDTIVARDDAMKLQQGRRVVKFAVETCTRAEP